MICNSCTSTLTSLYCNPLAMLLYSDSQTISTPTTSLAHEMLWYPVSLVKTLTTYCMSCTHDQKVSVFSTTPPDLTITFLSSHFYLKTHQLPYHSIFSIHYYLLYTPTHTLLLEFISFSSSQSAYFLNLIFLSVLFLF